MTSTYKHVLLPHLRFVFVLEYFKPLPKPPPQQKRSLVNTIFILDMIFQFFLPVRLGPKLGGVMIKSHKKIAIHYVSAKHSLLPDCNLRIATTSAIRERMA